MNTTNNRTIIFVVVSILGIALSAAAWWNGHRTTAQPPAVATDDQPPVSGQSKDKQSSAEEQRLAEQRLAEERRRQMLRAARQTARDRAKRLLQVADADCARRRNDCLRPLELFFAHAKGGLPAFAADSLGWGSKYYLVRDCVPFTSHDRHARFLNECFVEHVFRSADLERAMASCFEQFEREANDVESQLLIDLQLDMADLPADALPQLAGAGRLMEAYRQALAVGGEYARGDVVRLVEQTIVTEVLTLAATRLGMSGAVLGVGASGSWASAGATLAVAVIIDYLVGVAWDWYADPQGELVREMSNQLDRVRRLLVHGDGTAPGLAAHLERTDRERAARRRQVIVEQLLAE